MPLWRKDVRGKIYGNKKGLKQSQIYPVAFAYHVVTEHLKFYFGNYSAQST